MWVTADIGEINVSRGHYYLSLIEKEGEEVIAEMPAVIWATDFRRIKRLLAADTEGVLAQGVAVRVKGRLDFHERYGVKFIIEEVDPAYTFGKQAMQRKQLLEALQKEGLIGLNATQYLPIVVQRLAVISSETAAGWQDFKEHLANNHYAYSFDIQLFTAAMQGVFLEREILQQLDIIRLEKDNFDAVIIIRGGGAKLDLAAFDTPSVVRAIAAFPLPVLTGIGHDTDSSLTDIVAHTALKTPTAVADFLLDKCLEFEHKINEITYFFTFYTQNRLNTEGGQIERYEQFLKYKTDFFLKKEIQKVENSENKIALVSKQIVKYENLKLDNIHNMIDVMSIETTLRRGFSITRNEEGKVIKSIENLAENQIITTEMIDGIVKSKIITNM